MDNEIHFKEGKVGGVKGYRIVDGPDPIIRFRSDKMNSKRKKIRKLRKYKKKLMRKQKRK